MKAQARMLDSHLEARINSHRKQREGENWVEEGMGRGMSWYRIRCGEGQERGPGK
jgi:adenosyl cobinamide kinase/adenosyl cobinamide phosphate guanylyltransferase